MSGLLVVDRFRVTNWFCVRKWMRSAWNAKCSGGYGAFIRWGRRMRRVRVGDIVMTTQVCTMKCPKCGNTATKPKPADQFKCEQCGWKL